MLAHNEIYMYISRWAFMGGAPGLQVYKFNTETGAIDLSRTIQWAESIEADASVSDITVLMNNENILETINRHGLVIGVVAFEFSGQNYYFDLSDWLK